MTGFGAPAFNFAADILVMISGEAERMSNTCEDALVIKDVVLEASNALRSEAMKAIRDETLFVV